VREEAELKGRETCKKERARWFLHKVFFSTVFVSFLFFSHFFVFFLLLTFCFLPGSLSPPFYLPNLCAVDTNLSAASLTPRRVASLSGPMG
jgi:hypothetical protein